MLAMTEALFWTGAALDAAATAALLHPERAGRLLGTSQAPDAGQRYLGRTAAALMAGWTALLIWGAMDPLSRRVLLVITAAPVVLGLIAAEVAAIREGALGQAAWGLIAAQSALAAALLWAGATPI